MGILTEEGLGFKHETFHVPNLVHIIFTGKHSRPLLFEHCKKELSLTNSVQRLNQQSNLHHLGEPK